jgi:hypothetical protein
MDHKELHRPCRDMRMGVYARPVELCDNQRKRGRQRYPSRQKSWRKISLTTRIASCFNADWLLLVLASSSNSRISRKAIDIRGRVCSSLRCLLPSGISSCATGTLNEGQTSIKQLENVVLAIRRRDNISEERSMTGLSPMRRCLWVNLVDKLYNPCRSSGRAEMHGTILERSRLGPAGTQKDH